MTDNTTEVDLLTLGEKSTAFFFTFTHYIPSAGLQITVDHWTLAAQNLLMSNESLTAVRHNIWTYFKTIIFHSRWEKPWSDH